MAFRAAYPRSHFGRWASKASHWMGHPAGFAGALALVILWAATGPLFGYSNTWQLVINTGTTVITFLMVFLIQNTQNRESRAIQIKLDELIRASEGAHNALLNLEELEEGELSKIGEQYLQLAREARADLQKGLKDTGSVDLKKSP
jgi:low affinity Fe/Cu permease